jgi:translation initiation factor eIF-2B subunit delta
LFASEPSKRVLITETKNEVDATSVPQKPKLSKAERRAIQEAQRAAKAAAKEAGN